MQAAAGAGPLITSTISSDGALLSASPKREKANDAHGGLLLLKLGDRGVLVVKDVTSVLSMNRDLRGTVLDPHRHGHQQAPAPGWAPPGQRPDPRQWQAPQYVAAYPPPPPPPKKRRRWPWIVGAVVLLFIIVGVSNNPRPAATSATVAGAGCADSAGCATVPNMIGKTRSAASSAMDEAGFTGGREEFGQVPEFSLVIAQTRCLGR